MRWRTWRPTRSTASTRRANASGRGRRPTGRMATIRGRNASRAVRGRTRRARRRWPASAAWAAGTATTARWTTGIISGRTGERTTPTRRRWRRGPGLTAARAASRSTRAPACATSAPPGDARRTCATGASGRTAPSASWIPPKRGRRRVAAAGAATAGGARSGRRMATAIRRLPASASGSATSCGRARYAAPWPRSRWAGRTRRRPGRGATGRRECGRAAAMPFTGRGAAWRTIREARTRAPLSWRARRAAAACTPPLGARR